MREESGVYFVPIKLNGVDMEFVFDTGASSISISETEAMFLWKQGKLKENDIKENVQFIDANGDISNGTRINLREVQIGDLIVYDVEASVVHNQQAPLLFGQSAMNRFGKITIDYENNRIIFN
jgi:aspartyl protease family protein